MKRIIFILGIMGLGIVAACTQGNVAAVVPFGRPAAAQAVTAASTEPALSLPKGSVQAVSPCASLKSDSSQLPACEPQELGAFPRLASYNIGAPHNYDELAYQQQLAKRDLIILGLYNGWDEGGKTPAQVVSEIKALNPDILIGNYTIMEIVMDSEISPLGEAYKRDKLSAEVGPEGIGDWWARDSSGAITDWTNGVWGTHDANITSFVTPDTSGDRWSQWLAKKDYELLFNGVGFDFWFSDDNFWRPRTNADWNRDGTNDDMNDIAVQGWWHAGQQAYYNQIALTAPNLYLMTNVDNDLSGEVFPPEAEPFNEYKNILHGALMEHVISKRPWAVETWGGWEMMMTWYYELFDNLLEPKLVIFEVWGDVDDYQTFRYAFASTLLNDGYFAYSIDEDYNSFEPLAWFDEYDLVGTAATKWLGAAVDAPPQIPWQDGVYRREFENGLVLVNPNCCPCVVAAYNVFHAAWVVSNCVRGVHNTNKPPLGNGRT